MLPLRLHTHYSLLQSSIKPDQLVQKAKELGYEALAITDLSTVSGTIAFVKACKKENIKPIIGCELSFRRDDTVGTLLLLCQNKEGYKTLLNLISRVNLSDDGILDFEQEFKPEFNESFVIIDGYPNSLANNSGHAIINLSNYFLMYNPEEGLAKEKGNYVPGFLTSYLNKEDAIDHRILLCTKEKATLNNIRAKTDNPEILKFFDSDSYYLRHSLELVQAPGAANLTKIIGLCEDYELLSPPNIPHFKYPEEFKSEDDYLRHLCRQGWRKKINNTPNATNKVYVDRVEYELDQISEADLAGYFLIVQDYINYIRSCGFIIGHGRGSGAGSIVGYLLGITGVDPVLYDLLWERFYNISRKGSLPDYDIDFEPESRDIVIEYMKETYGYDKVAQMVTFGKLQGRGSLKEVLRVNNYCDFMMMNTITACIVSEAAISDKLEEMEHPSAILWTLENEPDELRDFCYLKDGELCGEYAEAFKQALRIEGCYRSQGKHAAGVVISAMPLKDICPMIKSAKGDELIAGFEMGYLEAIGCVKMDVLGLSALTKIKNCIEEINESIHSKKD